jgi:predicted oxidoreductase
MAFTKDTVSPFIIGTMRLGAWGAQFKTKQLESYIEECLAMGLKDFDFADIYGAYTTEGDFGDVFKSNPSLRYKIRVTTKCGIKMITPNRPGNSVKSYDLSSKHIRNSVETSLKNLNTDQLDLLLLHRPDYLMNPHDVAEVFSKLKAEGKVVDFGVSNFSVSQFDLLDSLTPLVTNQLEISLQYRVAFENGTLDQCLKRQIVPTAWSPLGGGAFMRLSSNPRIQAVKVAAKALGLKL